MAAGGARAYSEGMSDEALGELIMAVAIAVGPWWLLRCWSDWRERRRERHGYVPFDAPIPPRARR